MTFAARCEGTVIAKKVLDGCLTPAFLTGKVSPADFAEKNWPDPARFACLRPACIPAARSEGTVIPPLTGFSYRMRVVGKRKPALRRVGFSYRMRIEGEKKPRPRPGQCYMGPVSLGQFIPFRLQVVRDRTMESVGRILIMRHLPFLTILFQGLALIMIKHGSK